MKDCARTVDYVSKSVDQDTKHVTELLRERAKIVDTWNGDIKVMMDA